MKLTASLSRSRRRLLRKIGLKPRKKRKPEEKRLSPLPNADKYAQIVTRFSPNPDCVLHLGSARAILLSHEYARMYNGKFILRFEDTDPKIKRPSLIFYDSIRQDLKWLGCKVDEEYIQSDRLPIYYDYTERLIRGGNAYVCECPHRRVPKKNHSERTLPLPKPVSQRRTWNAGTAC